MTYGLYNNYNKTYLTHPRVGIWQTDDEQAAKDMLAACLEYVKACGFDHLLDAISIVDLDVRSSQMPRSPL